MHIKTNLFNRIIHTGYEVAEPVESFSLVDQLFDHARDFCQCFRLCNQLDSCQYNNTMLS